jgi:hypothetical protein
VAEEPQDLREAVERNAQAVMTGNFVQLMADITPEALAKLMQMAPPGGAPSIASLPAITGYEVEFLGPEADAQRYRARFTSANAAASFTTSWKQILGQWKVVDFADVVIEDGRETAQT